MKKLLKCFLTFLLICPQVLLADITGRPFVSTGTLELNMSANIYHH